MYGPVRTLKGFEWAGTLKLFSGMQLSLKFGESTCLYEFTKDL